MNRHPEKHFTSTATVRDIIIGMSDGLTVPFALAAGLSGAISSTAIVITAGLAEIAAGSISMGLGGYLAAKSDAEHYESELQREQHEIIEFPEQEQQEVLEVFVQYGLDQEEIKPIIEHMVKQPKIWVDFMMRFELGLDQPEPKRALQSARTIALAYIVGGLIPLFPYMIVHKIHTALILSVIITLLALFVFGYIKGRFTGTRPFRSALQTTLIGGTAAFFAFIIARLISNGA